MGGTPEHVDQLFSQSNLVIQDVMPQLQLVSVCVLFSGPQPEKAENHGLNKGPLFYLHISSPQLCL